MILRSSLSRVAPLLFGGVGFLGCSEAAQDPAPGGSAGGGGSASGGTASGAGTASLGGSSSSAAGQSGSAGSTSAGTASGGSSTAGTSAGGSAMGGSSVAGEANGGSSAAGNAGVAGGGGSAGSAGSGGGGSSGITGVVGQPVGFATLNGGTTGGKAGQTVTVKTYADLKSYAEKTEPFVILVEGTITNGAAGGQIRVKSNKSIVGLGAGAFLSGVGIDISNNNNVILQNLRATLIGTTTPGSVNGGDVISISGTSKNVWIDHCEVYSEDPSKQTDKDKYDGLIDVKGQTGFITISWTYWHDHHKGGLVGAADDDLFDDRKVTLHHNYYKNVLLRVPMYRGSVGHFFNNYIVGAKDATEIRANTCVRVERNYYESLNYSIYTPADAPGKTERIDNVEVKRASRAYPASCTADIPYSYSSVLTSNANDVKTVVPASAGVGKL